MSVSSTIKDNYITPISNIELLQTKIDESNKLKNNSKKFFLRTGRPGKLILKPNYTAFTKTSLGSIPSKLEKTLIKTDTNKPISTFISNTMSSFNKKNEIDKIPKEEKDIRKYTTSFSSKGYGVGFVSKVNRFGDNLSAYEPGPAEYSPEKNLTLLSKVQRSTFGKSFFKKKSSMSLSNYNSNFTPQSTMKSSSMSKINDSSQKDLSNDLNSSEKNKGTYNFSSTSDRFYGGIFGVKNINPGPGKYFYGANNISVKDPEKLSSAFVSPQAKMINPINFFGLNKNEKKKFGYHLSNKKKNGKIVYVWKGLKSINNEDNIFNNKKFDRSNISLDNNSTKITSGISNNNSSYFPSIYNADKRNKNNSTKTEYISIYPEYNLSSINGFDETLLKKNQFSNNIKKIIKFKRKDYFSLSAPRWDEGYFHDNESHFQVPGPAYYTPKIQNTKKSFNLNKKDFIFTNSLPFKNDEIYSISNVLI